MEISAEERDRFGPPKSKPEISISITNVRYVREAPQPTNPYHIATDETTGARPVFLTVSFSPSAPIVQIAELTLEFSCAPSSQTLCFNRGIAVNAPSLPMKVDIVEVRTIESAPTDRKGGYVRLMAMAAGVRVRSEWAKMPMTKDEIACMPMRYECDMR